MTSHKLPDLPYPKNSLEPYISTETIDYHYGKHHASYVDKLNNLIRDSEFEKAPLEQIIMEATGGIFNNAAQVWNHTFYWNCLSPESDGKPGNNLAKAMDKVFGGFSEFKNQFSEKAAANFGSGWTWLVSTPEGDLEIMNTSNANNPMTDNKRPLLTCDVWEHAYYIDYRNARPEYIKAFWNIVNWSFVTQNFSK